MIGEGLGKDEKEARKAAFHDAVSKVVGSLVDSETLVKNDEIISERILEFSGGFIKNYVVIKSEKADGDMVRIRIRAVVERLQIVSRLTDMKVTTKEIKGTDLLAEKMTKEEARKNATELLAKLYGDLPKMIKGEVLGKPELSKDGDGVNLQLILRADLKAYGDFAKRATGILDKIAVLKGSFIMPAPGPDQEGNMTIVNYGMRLFKIPKPNENLPPGYPIFLLADIDGTGTRTRWNYYWVDAEASKTIETLTGKLILRIKLIDGKRELVTPLSRNGLDQKNYFGYLRGHENHYAIPASRAC